LVAPAGGVAEWLAGVWAQVLGVDRVGARDDFFQLGGHSLLATQVISRIRDEFGVEIPLGTLFDQPTIAATAAAINRARFGIDGDAEEYEEFEL
jgi:acyl carrier protein